jgi:hypothetical protein
LALGLLLVAVLLASLVGLIESALLISIPNVTLFAIIYTFLGEREFAFPKSTDAVPARLCFLDYFFLSFTTATALSPTDTSPLSTRVRMLMHDGRIGRFTAHHCNRRSTSN